MNRQIARPLTEDVVDLIAREIGLVVADHIETMYPQAAQAVAWNSAKLSIQGTIRNAVKSAGDSAERGEAESWVSQSRKHRAEMRRLRREADDAERRREYRAEQKFFNQG